VELVGTLAAGTCHRREMLLASSQPIGLPGQQTDRRRSTFMTCI
jgi:hypothetical protein